MGAGWSSRRTATFPTSSSFIGSPDARDPPPGGHQDRYALGDVLGVRRLKTSVPYALIGTVLGEMIASNRGLAISCNFRARSSILREYSPCSW